ncbi:MAG: hypothetical protein JSV84_07340, partial [Gemmatimonadota bacterium]
MRIPHLIRRGWIHSRYFVTVGIITLFVFPFFSVFIDTVSAQDSTVSISGTVRYFRGDVPMDSVELILSGGVSNTTFTDTDGRFQFDGLQAGLDYFVTPSRVDNDKPVTAFDASLLLRTLCGVTTLSHYDSIAADVTQDGTVSAY